MAVRLPMTADENLRMIREIEANRDFILAAYRQNPWLLNRAEPSIRQLFSPLPEPETQEQETTA